MAEYIEIELAIVEPIQLELDTAPVYYIGTAQAGPTGPKGDKGDPGTGIDADTLTGTIYGGLFQP